MSDLRRRMRMKQRQAEMGREMKAETASHISEHMATFKDRLEDFARKHKSAINRDPIFRHQFSKMTSAVGVDPLMSGKGFWATTLGMGDFYFELAVQIVEICIRTRPLNGGFIKLSELIYQLRKIRTGVDIGDDDVERAIGKIRLLSAGYRIETIGGERIVVSVPYELNTDQSAILALAKDAPSLTVAGISTTLGWASDRIIRALQKMTQSGIVWIDEKNPDGDTLYWFPSMSFNSSS